MDSKDINLDSKSTKFVTVDLSQEEDRGLHRVLIGIATFFFIWLIVEGILLVPILFTKYGLH